jgi:hypothetical protein
MQRRNVTQRDSPEGSATVPERYRVKKTLRNPRKDSLWLTLLLGKN